MLSRAKPGEIRAALPASPPRKAEPLDRLLDDVERLIVPGLTSSDLPGHMLRNTGRMKIDFTRGMAPEKVASGIVRGLQRNKKETVLGGDARWLLRFNRFLPRLVDWLIVRRVRKLYA